MRVKYVFLILLFIQGVNTFATVQQSDFLVYDGIKYFIDENPMEEYFNRFPLRKPKSGWISSSLWRGYIATFEIINNELYVIDIEIQGELIKIDKYWTLELISVKNKSLKGKDKIKADWFTGLLGLSQSIYSNENEYYKMIEIENGNIVLEYDVSNEQYYEYIRIKYLIDDGLINELNIRSMSDELLNFLNRYIKNGNLRKSTVQNYIPLWKLIIIISGLFIIIGCIILFIINIKKIKNFVYIKRRK